MSLVEELTRIQAELDAERERIVVDKQGLQRREDGIAAREKEVQGRENALLDKVASLEEQERRIQKVEEKIGDAAALEAKRVMLLRKERELHEYENELALIKTRQQEKEEKLSSERRELEEDKATYVEKLKKQFIEQLQRAV